MPQRRVHPWMKSSAHNAEVAGAFEAPTTVDDPAPPRTVDPDDTVRLPIVERTIRVDRRIALGF